MAKYTIVLTPRAIREIQAAIDYYDNQQIGLGKRFFTAFKKRLSIITRNPYIHAIRYDDIRFALIDKFPYSAHYNIEGNKLIILGVLSMHQDPETSWIRKE